MFSQKKKHISHLGVPDSKVIGPIWGPSGSCRPQMGPMLAPWTLLSGVLQGGIYCEYVEIKSLCHDANCDVIRRGFTVTITV